MDDATVYLWKIERTDDPDLWQWDEFDSAIVSALTMADARIIPPGPSTPGSPTWVDAKHVGVTAIGRAAPHIKPGEVLCASFNAG